jgi:hypothetical protein
MSESDFQSAGSPTARGKANCALVATGFKTHHLASFQRVGIAGD